MNTESTTSTSAKSKVVELLNELGSIEQQQHELQVKARNTVAELYREKARIIQENPEAAAEAENARKVGQRFLMKLRYETKNGLTIHNLRQAGHVVSISHIRYSDVEGVKNPVPVPSYLRGAFKLSPRGGATHISILKPNGEWICVSSICHQDDCFDYKLGVKTALEQLTQAEADELLTPVEHDKE